MLKTATHEIAHTFEMNHCIEFECNMNGSNHLAELDSHPLYLCPHCFAKVNFSPMKATQRLRKLLDFCQENGLQREADYYEKAIEAFGSEIDRRVIAR